jgi:2,5-furandicarboxylate decarboxylase 1
MVSAVLDVPSGVDELSIANAMEDTPLVKCKTKDLEVPADTEIVLEGRVVHAKDRHGPFVNPVGKRNPAMEQPVVVIDAITMRKDAMYDQILPGGRAHTLMLWGIPKEPTVCAAVNKVCSCTNVHMTPGGDSFLHCVIQLDKKSDADPKNAFEAAIKAFPFLKQVTVVDKDVDIFSPECVELAVANRFRADTGLTVLKDQPSSPMDPTATQTPNGPACAKMLVDATIPMNADKAKFGRESYKKVDLSAFRR